MKPLPITVISGFVGTGKTSLLNHLLKNRGELRAAVIVNDLTRQTINPHLEPGTEVRRPIEKLVQMHDGCICCTLHDQLIETVAGLSNSGQYDFLLIEATGIAEPLSIAEALCLEDPDGKSPAQPARLDTMITVVDASTFLQELSSTDELGDRGIGVDDEDDRSVVELVIDQVEFADVIVINKADLIEKDELDRLELILRHLNRDARLIRSQFGGVPLDQAVNTGLFDFEKNLGSPGWFKELGGEHVPKSPDHDVCSFLFQARRPFHPERLWDFVDSDLLDSVIRSRGVVWLASRMDLAGMWSQAGQALQLNPAGAWWDAVPLDDWPADDAEKAEIRSLFSGPFGDRRQELVFTGVDLDPQELKSALEDCLLTSEELALGPDAWLEYEDQFPEWHLHDPDCQHDHDCGHDH